MAWGISTLKFDVEEIREMRNKINSTSSDLRNLKNRLLKEIEELKGDWKTPAGKKFFENVDADWAQQVDKYLKVIEAVDELLEVAEKAYKEVEEEAKKLSF